MPSYFNEEQQEHMKEIAEIPRDRRCRCGWYLKDACPHCNKQTDNQYTDRGKRGTKLRNLHSYNPFVA